MRYWLLFEMLVFRFHHQRVIIKRWTASHEFIFKYCTQGLDDAIWRSHGFKIHQGDQEFLQPFDMNYLR